MSNIPRKGDIIINPNTQRPVKVGSRTWLKLVKQGVVEGRYTDPKEIATLPEKYEELPPEEVEEEIKRANEGLPRHQQAVRGRGRYKGKIVKRNRRLAPQEVSKYTAQVATRAVANNIETLANSEDDIEGMLEKMILEEMMGGRPQTAPQRTNHTTVKRGRGRPRKAQQEEKYEEIQPQEYDEYDELIDEQYTNTPQEEYEDYEDYEY